MLYVSTRNASDAFTVHRAIHEERSPDGGFYIPFRYPVISPEELASFKGKTQGEIIAAVLNRYFGTRLTGWDVESAVGRVPLKTETTNQKILFVECWRNAFGSFEYLLSSIYALLTGDKNSQTSPHGWARVAIVVSLYFAMYSAIGFPENGIDIAVSTEDLANATAALYARAMGLPMNNLICACDSNIGIWNLINKGELNCGGSPVPWQQSEQRNANTDYMELFLYRFLGPNRLMRYLEACERKASYCLDEDELRVLNQGVFAFVVSTDRINAIINTLLRTNGYAADSNTAIAYAGVQDYRSRTGINKETLIPALYRPQRDKE